MNIENHTIEQLKALAYDLIVQLEQVQKNLQVVNNAIMNKNNAPKKSKENG